MSQCPICNAQITSTNADDICEHCRKRAVVLLRNLTPELGECLKVTIHSEFRDRDVVEFKTAQIAAAKIIEWTKPIGYLLAGVAALLTFLGVKSSIDVNGALAQVKHDLNESHESLLRAKGELAALDALLGQAKEASSKIDGFSNRLASLNAGIDALPGDMRIGTVYNQLEHSSTWTTNFGFPVKAAIAIHVDHFENIKGINAIDPQTDIDGDEVTYTIRKANPDDLVGIRILAWGFGRKTDSNLETK